MLTDLGAGVIWFWLNSHDLIGNMECMHGPCVLGCIWLANVSMWRVKTKCIAFQTSVCDEFIVHVHIVMTIIIIIISVGLVSCFFSPVCGTAMKNSRYTLPLPGKGWDWFQGNPSSPMTRLLIIEQLWETYIDSLRLLFFISSQRL